MVHRCMPMEFARLRAAPIDGFDWSNPPAPAAGVLVTFECGVIWGVGRRPSLGIGGNGTLELSICGLGSSVFGMLLLLLFWQASVGVCSLAALISATPDRRSGWGGTGVWQGDGLG